MFIKLLVYREFLNLTDSSSTSSKSNPFIK